jgi:hypothetical protein
MAGTIKLTELDQITDLDKEALLYIVQGEKSYSATVDQLLTLLSVNGAKLKSSGTSGNWSSNYSDNPRNDSASGHFGTTRYWKTTGILYQVPKGLDVTAFVRLELTQSSGIPCDASGNPLPYQLVVGQIKYSATQVPFVDIWLFVNGEPTQLMSMISKELSPIGLVDGVQYDPNYTLSYWWTE